MSNILMSSDKEGTFKLEFVDNVPEGAVYDNWADVDGVHYKVYVMPNTQVFGRSAVLQMWLEDQLTDEPEPEPDDPNIAKCPECGRKQGDLRWPVIQTGEGYGHLHQFLFCTNCGWDSLQPTRKMSRETYQYLWQRYRLMWGRHLKARPISRGYHAPQAMVNFGRSFISPRWMSSHFHGAMSWLQWEKNWREVEYPNMSLWDWHASREYHPEVTWEQWLQKRREQAEYDRLHPRDPYEEDYPYTDY